MRIVRQRNGSEAGDLLNPDGQGNALAEPIRLRLHDVADSDAKPKAQAAGSGNRQGHFEQGALETSNVNIVQEITSLIQAQRAYEMNSKVIQAGDEMLTTITQMR